MIADSSRPSFSVAPSSRQKEKAGEVRTAMLVFVVLGLVALFLQWRSGAWEAEFGGHPDEAAHVVSGLMVRDYVVTAFGQNPATFAKEYYASYPKVAIGHYPPGFYLLEAFWLMVVPPVPAAFLGLMVLQCAALGTLLYQVAARSLGRGYGFWCAVMVVTFPLTQRYTSIVMSDILLAFLCFWAMAVYAAYLERPSARSSLLFGLLAAAAILVKGAGMLLALVPGLFLLLTGRWSFIRKPSFWLAPLPVLFLAAPWMVATYSIPQRGMAQIPPLRYFREAFPYYSRTLVEQWGWVALVAALAGLGWLGYNAWRSRRAFSPDEALPVVLVVSTFFFYCGTPSGLDERYLLPLSLGFFLLIAHFLFLLSRCLKASSPYALAFKYLVPVALSLGIWSQSFRIPEKRFSGFDAMVSELLESGGSGEVLISSDAKGEGAFIASLALRDRARQWRVHRSSKMLGESDWLGRGYSSRFDSEEELAGFLSSSSLSAIIRDRSVHESLFRTDHALLGGVFDRQLCPGYSTVDHYPVDRKDESSPQRNALLYQRR